MTTETTTTETTTETTTTNFTEEHLTLVRTFQTLTGADKLAEMVCNESIQKFRAQFFSTDGESPVEDVDIPENFLKLIHLVEQKHLEWKPQLQLVLEQVYAQTFTEDDLRALVVFCETDTGKKVLEKGGLRVPYCGDQCVLWSGEVYRRTTALPEFTLLANGEDAAAKPAREFTPGETTIPTTNGTTP